MMGLSPTHIVILAVIAVLLFGGGRFSNIMSDVAKGVKNFKNGMTEPHEDHAPDALIPSQAPLAPEATAHDLKVAGLDKA